MKIALLATGGTIAMPAGAEPSVDGEALTASGGWPIGIEVVPRQVLQKASSSLTLADLQILADTVRDEIAAGAAGVVVTHGTDTLEETAYALSLMLEPGAPVVLTGAMRTPDRPGADGPANVAAAVLTAASAEAAGLAPLAVIGDEIHLGTLVRKAHTHRPAAFTSAPLGPIGYVVEGRAAIRLRPTPSARPTLRVGAEVAPIAILEVGMDLEPAVISAFLDAPIGGLVLAAAGGGHVSAASANRLEALAARIPVVLASRTGAGQTLANSYGYAGGEIDLGRRGLINAGPLRPVQARILMQLVLSGGGGPDALRRAFASL